MYNSWFSQATIINPQPVLPKEKKCHKAAKYLQQNKQINKLCIYFKRKNSLDAKKLNCLSGFFFNKPQNSHQTTRFFTATYGKKKPKVVMLTLNFRAGDGLEDEVWKC